MSGVNIWTKGLCWEVPSLVGRLLPPDILLEDLRVVDGAGHSAALWLLSILCPPGLVSMATMAVGPLRKAGNCWHLGPAV